MDQPTEASEHRRYSDDVGPCEAELHFRLCARQLSTGHIQFRWRAESIWGRGDSSDSSDGVFPPFQLPHESASDVAAMIRTWFHITPKRIYDAERDRLKDWEGTQLTLREFLQD